MKNLKIKFQLAKGSSISNVYNSDLKKLSDNSSSFFRTTKDSFISSVDKKSNLFTTKKRTFTEISKRDNAKILFERVTL